MPALLLLLLALLLTACGGVPRPIPPPGLGYRMPADTAATYLYGDTAEVEVDAGGQTVPMRVASGATLAMSFADSMGALRVSVRFEEFEGRESNPLGGEQVTNPTEVRGELVLAVDPGGETEVLVEPEVDGASQRFLSIAAFAPTLLPRLPDRAVHPGDRWVDTLEIDAAVPGGRVTGSSVRLFEVVGDTLVGVDSLGSGVPALLVHVSGTDKRTLEFEQDDMRTLQMLAGVSSGYLLFDLERALLLEWVYASELEGTAEVSAAPFPLSTRIRSRRILRLREAVRRFPNEETGRR